MKAKLHACQLKGVKSEHGSLRFTSGLKQFDCHQLIYQKTKRHIYNNIALFFSQPES